MFLSKIWFILVAVAAGVALSIALTAPRPMAQRLAELEGQRLDRAQYAAEQMLKVDAHKWIDRVAKLGRDAILSDALDSATRGAGELGVQHKTVQSRIRSLLPDLGTAGIVGIIASDANGRVVARVGENEKDYGENIGGAEVIADALRGYLSDDVWGAGGKLARVAGGPVLSKGRDRIVGTLVVAAETGPQFAERLKKNLDMEVALLLRGKVVAATIDPSLLGSLPDLVSQHATEIEQMKRTAALPMDVGPNTLLAVAAPFPGQVAEQQGYYVLLGKKPARADLGSLLAATSASDLRWGNFPWISLGATILAVVAIGLFLQRLEIESPIKRLRAELRTLGKGEAAKLDDHRYAGLFGGIARDVNAAIEHHAVGSSLGATTVGHEMAAAAGDGQPSVGGFGAAPEAAALFGAPPPGAFIPPPPPSPAFAPPATAALSPPAFPSARSLPKPPAPPSASTSLFGGPAAGSPAPAPTADAHRASAEGNSGDDYDNDDDKHVQGVYLEFLAAKQQCGESSVGLTLDRFRQRLQENKTALMAKHVCRTVRFSVYVKDGKAALRATPLR